MSGTCVYVGYGVNGCRVWWEDLNEKDHLEDLGLYGQILKQVLRDRVGDHELDLMAQDRIKWRGVVTIVMNFRVP